MTKLPSFSNLPINRLSSIFEHTTNSYKLYWFYAILQLVKHKNRKVFSLDEVTVRAITSAWHTLNFFKISFGKQDQMAKSVGLIKSELQIADNEQELGIQFLILNAIQHNSKISTSCKRMQRYVPYRILSVFFANELKGKLDGKKNELIVDLASRSFIDDSLNTSLYRFLENNRIEINSLWFDYINKNVKILEGFCLYHLVGFLQNRNPNTPNIGRKLFFPTLERDLKFARKFWNLYLSENNVRCIFSGEVIAASRYSIDHFIPWSFVTHDLLWNLIPTTVKVNSTKNNNIPNLEAYFHSFVKIQYNAFQFVNTAGENKLLEDYSLLFDLRISDIAKMNQNEFAAEIGRHIFPISQIAENVGFNGNWLYQNKL